MFRLTPNARSSRVDVSPGWFAATCPGSPPETQEQHMVAITAVPSPRHLPSNPRRVRAEEPRRHRAAAVYRRRRLVAAALGVGLVLVAGQAAAALGGSSLAPAERRPHVQTVVVESGDTLWSIAREVAPHSDPRDVVDALVQARGTASLVPGETITWVDG